MLTYILWESTKALQVQEVKVNAKYEDLDTWMLKNDVPQEMKTVVVKIIKHKQVVEKNYAAGLDVDVDVDLVFHAIIADGNYSLLLDFRKHFCLDALKKVFILQNLRGFNSPYLLFNVLHPVIYEENSYVVRAGDPDDRMLIITQGVIVCTDRFRANAATAVSSSMIPKSRFEKGEVYGGQLLTIEVDHPIPISSRDVKCHTKVEAFALTSDGLKSVVEWRPVHKRSRLFDQWNNPELVNKTYRKLTTTRSEKLMQQQMKMNRKVNDISKWLSKNNVPNSLKAEVMKHARGNNVLEKDIGADVDLMYLFSIDLPWDLEYLLKKHLCMSTLYKVPVLKDVDEDVLHRICMSLEPVILPENSCIVNVGDVIHSMLIIIEGEITSTNRTSEYVVGEELLSWALPDEYISNSQPATSTECVKCCAKVEAFALTMDGLESVLTYYNDGINKFEQLENSRDGLADAKGASTSSTIEQKLDQLIQLHGDILHQHRDEMANQGRRLDDMAAFLAGLGYSTVPPPPPEA
ncbi:uncharacterized protein LOC133723169 [Rosa rugosa]|uniref:uncharacterized protein LOC133723169 n=1 Tax=Rosa rugosa TaxID=74645 RepID=UPI002B4181F0|nr:uncharacterized protein LOC133723169 [Rosa rugosa]